MTTVSPTIELEVERYLRTGHTDEHYRAWPSHSFFERARLANEDLVAALVAEVRRRTANLHLADALNGLDVVAFTRRKVMPMVGGLFPRVEQAPVIATLERSVVFLTPANIEAVLRDCSFLSSAWDIANLYLGSAGAELLGPEAPNIVGLSEHTTCYVSQAYFEPTNRFVDFLVHEAAHVFHNCKRQTIGLRAMRRREWLLDIDYGQRETFAYACEAYSRIIDAGRTPAQRQALAAEYRARSRISDERVDPTEVADIVCNAVTRRNGWKVILARCAPPKRARGRVSAALELRSSERS